MLLSFRKSPLKILFLGSVTAWLSGCAGLNSLQLDLSPPVSFDVPIDSSPVGAKVYIMGELVGHTPMKIKPDRFYPISYDISKENLYGKVVIKKEGCSDFVKRLTRNEYSKGLKAQLDCGMTPLDHTLKKASRLLSAPIKEKITTPPDQDSQQDLRIAEKKLKQLRVLQQLVEDGLLAEEQEKKLRKRILGFR